MIDHLDNLLRDLFMSQIRDATPERESILTSDEQVGFRPPDSDWRMQVNDLSDQGSQVALNVYLFDVRENRKLRSNERMRNIDDGVVTEEPAPARVDCHYLITAWRRRVVTVENEGMLGYTEDEHNLLYGAMAVLMNHAPLNPSRIYPAGSPQLTLGSPDVLPELIREADLPTQILPVEGFPKYAEFWGTMGAEHRWKPAIYLVVTLPVAFDAQIAGPVVTTPVMDAGPADQLDAIDTLVQIAGHVLDPSGTAVAGAWVRLEDVNGEPLQVTHSDASGRFTFGGLRPGQYQLRWRARGFTVPIPDIVQVPSPSGEYDLTFE